MSRNTITVLMYHRHKFLDLSYHSYFSQTCPTFCFNRHCKQYKKVDNKSFGWAKIT
jgi:hypothetical protein